MAIDVITLALAKGYTKEQITSLSAISPFSYKGSVSSSASLPTSAIKGDLYSTADDLNQYLYDGTNWIKFGGEVTKDMITDLQDTKQDKLVSGTNIKTINGETLLGNGNVSIDITYNDSATYSKGTFGYEINALKSSISSANNNLNKQIITLQNDKQDKLVSGTDIKTINNESLLGSGNISIDTSYDENKEYTEGTIGYEINKIKEETSIDKDWELKGRINVENSNISVDLTGCTEIMVRTNITSTNVASLYMMRGDSPFTCISGVSARGTYKFMSHLKDGLFGIETICCAYTSTEATLYTGTGTFVMAESLKVEDVTGFKLSSTSGMSACEVLVYAR